MADDDQRPADGDDGLSQHDHMALAAAHGDAIQAHAGSMTHHLLAALSPGQEGEDGGTGASDDNSDSNSRSAPVSIARNARLTPGGQHALHAATQGLQGG